MKPKKSTKPTTKDKKRQEEIEKRIVAEKINLGHPQGKERFEHTVKQMGKKQDG